MMSYAEKPEDITKEEWMDKLNNVHIQRADMNRLIMNYLVTGKAAACSRFKSPQLLCEQRRKNIWSTLVKCNYIHKNIVYIK